MKVSIEEFNLQVADAMATQFGKFAAGIEAEADDLPETCPLCGCRDGVAKRRRLSSYIEDENNWLVSCAACFDEDTDRLEHDWAEYYSMVY